MRIAGFVTDIKEKTTSVGPMYDLQVNGDYYGHGKFKPRDVNVGDYVEFEMEQRGNYRNIGRGTLRKTQAPAGAAPSASAPAPQRTPVASSFDDRQAVISKQAALNTAISFVELMVKSQALSLGANPGAKGAALLEAAVFEYAGKFHKFSTGVEVELPEVEEPAKAKRGAKAPATPAEGEWED